MQSHPCTFTGRTNLWARTHQLGESTIIRNPFMVLPLEWLPYLNGEDGCDFQYWKWESGALQIDWTLSWIWMIQMRISRDCVVPCACTHVLYCDSGCMRNGSCVRSDLDGEKHHWNASGRGVHSETVHAQFPSNAGAIDFNHPNGFLLLMRLLRPRATQVRVVNPSPFVCLPPVFDLKRFPVAT